MWGVFYASCIIIQFLPQIFTQSNQCLNIGIAITTHFGSDKISVNYAVINADLTNRIAIVHACILLKAVHEY